MTDWRTASHQGHPLPSLWPNGQPRKKFKDLVTDEEFWWWHADVYAFRRVYLGVPDFEHTSPCDPNGEWFDEGRVHRLTLEKRRALVEHQARCDAVKSPMQQQWERRAAEIDASFEIKKNEYARLHGYANWDAVLDAMQNGTVVHGVSAAGLLAYARAGGEPTAVSGFKTMASALGVTATEIPSDDYL